MTGWFSLQGGGAPAGDVACDWLTERGIAFDVAQERALGWPAGDQARELARATAERLAGDIGEVRAALERALGRR